MIHHDVKGRDAQLAPTKTGQSVASPAQSVGHSRKWCLKSIAIITKNSILKATTQR